MVQKNYHKRTFHTIDVMYEDKFILFLILFILLLSLLLQAKNVYAASTLTRDAHSPLGGYCNNPDPHCYALQGWNGAPGAFTEIQPFGALTCNNCSGFVDDEMWLFDQNDSVCTNDSEGACWIESGISTWPANDPNSCNQGTDSTCLFWADSRATGGYHEHSLYDFGSDGVDLTPYYVALTLNNNGGDTDSGSTWDVSASIYDENAIISNVSGQSRANNMNISGINIGSELSNTGATAGDVYFAYNEWDNNSTWNYQTNSGTNLSTNAPPTGYWVTNPCQCSGNIGGVYLTYDN